MPGHSLARWQGSLLASRFAVVVPGRARHFRIAPEADISLMRGIRRNGPQPAVSNCNKSWTEASARTNSGLRRYRFRFGSFRLGGFRHLKEEDDYGHEGGGA